MPIASTGPVTFTSLRTEFIGGSAAINFSDLYSGGANSYIRTPAANNTATSLSPNVPTSGAIAVSNFRGASKGFRFTFTSNATNQDASAIFGDDYGVDYPKEIVIDSGVELGGTSASEEALQINSGGLGTIKIINNGTLTGAGGAANGGAGGDAFEANVACIFINNGSIRSGGGGGARGGNGGSGGGGRYTSVAGNHTYYKRESTNNKYCSQLTGAGECPTSWRGYTYSNLYYGSCTNGRDEHNCSYNCYGRRNTTVNTSGGGGGGGGNGGRGEGYNQTRASGSGGSGGANGGTNAGRGGTGGTGGTGGLFGADGSGGTNGSGGNNGNRTNGSGGGSATSAGAAGKSIRGVSSVTLTNNGTIIGGQV